MGVTPRRSGWEAPMPSQNLATLEWLFAEDRIALKRGDLFDTSPPPLAGGVSWDRVEGMLLGLAVGDSLGNLTEGELPEDRAEEFGPIRDYLPNFLAGDRRVGLPTDDTQLAFWTLEQLIEDGG